MPIWIRIQIGRFRARFRRASPGDRGGAADGLRILPTWSDTLRRLGFAAPFYLCLLVAVLALMLHRPVLAIVMAVPMAGNVAWMLWRREGALQDRWSATRVVRGD